MCDAIAQPTARRLETSRTTARNKNPAIVGMSVISAIAHVDLRVTQIGLNAETTVGTARLPVGRLDPIAKHDVSATPLRRSTFTPRIPADRDAQNAARRSNRPAGLVRSHEFENFGGIESVSRANQAAAFERISRSIPSCRTRFWSRETSSCPAEIKPSDRRPLSRSSCLHQFEIVWRESWSS